MGLDITAYRKVRFVREARGDDDDDDLNRLGPNSDFPAQADGLPDGFYECSGSRRAAIAAVYEGGPPDPDRLKFRAGSYSGYSEWRSRLAKMAGYSADHGGPWEVPEAGPFVELVNFSDCEGTIGPRTSAKLAKDFADWQERAKAFAESQGVDGEWFMSLYAKWRQAFEMAAGEGAVDFH